MIVFQCVVIVSIGRRLFLIEGLTVDMIVTVPLDLELDAPPQLENPILIGSVRAQKIKKKKAIEKIIPLFMIEWDEDPNMTDDSHFFRVPSFFPGGPVVGVGRAFDAGPIWFACTPTVI